ncbi:Nucleoside phosphorylase domain protein [Ophiocordyceps sinensis CO18]|uniref:Nucleoside phosphorylase domain protein n=1 Tax=Ophiocordyceps sinensis (strain Co18 / CGMCC 3.14243) TaxID=911162 RepID=T5A870_OPHSC|nr:Nucleoside phosphorylase domain protein [Ophiocordyceps sinensis CO18]
MGKHNIVIASLAAGLYGTTSAATTASKLLSSLPQIRIGLLVGVGGGIPRPGEGRDIRLGDIVVSQPDGATGGVVQYDLLKSKPNNRHERKDFLNMPPPVLLHALGKLRAEHEFEEPMVSKSLSKMLGDKPRMAKSRPGYVHQGFENDRLFPASYEHAGALDCRSCDPDKQVQRDMRDSTDPEIHYGIIASGNTLVKDAVERDKVVEHIGEDCFCVEMEAPGLMNHFPCLVIRGICDYADSHKDHRWQRYASATAAAFAKELLSYVPRHEASKRRRGLSSFSVETTAQSIHDVTRHTSTAIGSLLSDSSTSKISKWLSPPDTSMNRNTAKEKRHRGTGDWFVTSTVFLEWMSGLRRHLWVHGLAGCGKTVLTSTILDHICNFQADSHICIWFFFDFRDKNKQHLDDLLRSLAFQLSSQCADTREQLDNLFGSCKDGKEQPSTESLSTAMYKMMRSGKKLRIVLDALDECLTRGDLLRWMETLSSPELTNVHLVATSRREEELESGPGKWIQEDDMMLMNRDNVSGDIRSYIRARLRHSEQFQKRWASNPSVLEEIECTIGEKADGMFRWAACHSGQDRGQARGQARRQASWAGSWAGSLEGSFVGKPRGQARHVACLLIGRLP